MRSDRIRQRSLRQQGKDRLGYKLVPSFAKSSLILESFQPNFCYRLHDLESKRVKHPLSIAVPRLDSEL
jgi:hypothetical protein